MKTTKRSSVLPSMMTVLFAAIFAIAGWSAQIPGAGAAYAEDGQNWTPLAVESGYNTDVVIEGDPADTVGRIDRNYCLFAMDGQDGSLPLDGAFTSPDGKKYQLADYAGDNTLQMTSENTGGTLGFDAASKGKYEKLAVAVSGMHLGGTVTATIHFEDDSKTVTDVITVPDWTNTNGPIYDFRRMDPSNGEVDSAYILHMFDAEIDIPEENWDDVVTSIEFEVDSFTRSDYIMNIFGVTGIKARPQFTVGFDPAGGDAVDSIKARENSEITLPDATREGYELIGWYRGDTKVGDAGDQYIVTEDASLYARWTWTKATKNISIVDGGTAADIAGSQLSNVYFGNYKQSSDGNGGFKTEPIKWRVLDNADGKLMLLSDKNLDRKTFVSFASDGTAEQGYWPDVSIRSWLNGYDGSMNIWGTDYSNDNFKDRAFTEDEQFAIAETDCPNPISGSAEGLGNTNDKLFLLSYVEATKPAFGFADDFGATGTRAAKDTDYAVEKGADEGLWWLRSSQKSGYWPIRVDFSGTIGPRRGTYGGYTYIGARPAFNVDLGSVILTSAAAGGKASNGTGAGALKAVGENTGDEWKLTVKHGHDSFDVGEVTTCDGKNLDIPYSRAATGKDEFISAIIRGSDGQVKYYGRIKNLKSDSAASGTVKIDVVDKLEDGDSFYVFNEQYNGDRETDFSSPLKEVEIPNTQGHSLESVAKVDATCTESGHIAGWTCSLCERHFGDEQGITEIPDDEWFIPAKGHSLTKTEAVDATYTSEGNTEYWTCTVCGLFFADEKAENEIDENSWITPALIPKVTFDANGGKLTGEDTREVAVDTDIDLPEVSRKYYEFMGWYDGDTKVGDIAATYKVTKSVTLQARWEFKGSNGIVLVDNGVASNIKGGQGGNPDGGIWFGNYMQRGNLDKEEPAMYFAGDGDHIQGGQGGNPDGGICFGNYKQSSDGNGGFKNEPIRWRVLKRDDGDLFLISDKMLEYRAHRVSTLYSLNDKSVEWETSTLRSWLNGYGGEHNFDGINYSDSSFIDKAFNETERTLIKDTKVSADKSTSEGIVDCDTYDRIFLLSKGEINNESYGFTNGDTRQSYNTDYAMSLYMSISSNGLNGRWWTRSLAKEEYYEGQCNEMYEAPGGYEYSDQRKGVRPAMHFNYDAVLFTSDVVGGKLSGAVGQNALLLSRMHEAKNGWKLTLKDDGSEDAVGDGHSGFTVETATTKDGSILTIPYQNAATGDNEYISAIITDEAGRITYYGRLKNIKAASDARGEVKINISGKLATGDTLHIFNEQFNGDKTDYASAVVEVAIPEGCSLWRSDLTKDPIKWRVLQNEEGKLFLLADKILDAKPYNNDTKNYNDAITWAQCTLRSWLNGYDETENMELEDYTDDNFIGAAFDKGEQKSIATTALLNNQFNPFGDFVTTNPPEGFGGADTEDKVFLLSLSDAMNEDFGFEEGSLGDQRIINEYGEEELYWGYERSESRVVQMTDYVFEIPIIPNISNEGERTDTIGEDFSHPYWALRSPGNFPKYVSFVGKDGRIVGGMHSPGLTSHLSFPDWLPPGIRPAMNIDLETVAFTSTATGGKVSGKVGPGALNYVEGNLNDEWKLTVKQDHEDFTINSSSIDYDSAKSKVTVSFEGAVTGEKEYISALVKAKDGSVKYYGRILKPSAASGSLTIDIPDGYTCDDTLYVFNEQYNGDKMTDYCSELLEVPFEAEGHDWTWTKRDDKQHEGVCRHDGEHKKTENHTWDAGRVTKPATTAATGVKTFTCTKCAATRTDVIPKVIKGTGADPNLKGSDGTALGTGASAVAADKAITSMKKDADPAGSKFARLQLKSSKQTKTSVKIAWKKVSGAKKYVIYGNACGTKNKMKKLATVTGASKNFTKILGKKVKKGTYYKFLVVALDKNDKVVSSSKLIHVATTGGKVGNHKSVTVKAKVGKKTKAVSKVTVKRGKSLALKTTLNPKNKKLKVKKHVGARYESTNTKIATVSGKGVIKGKKKGTCYVYVYAQNGVFKKVKVTVK